RESSCPSSGTSARRASPCRSKSRRPGTAPRTLQKPTRAERSSTRRSLRLHAALLDDARPLLLLALEVGGGLLGRAVDDRQPALLPELHLVRHAEHLADVRVERVDNRARRALRRRDDVPSVELIAGHTR